MGKADLHIHTSASDGELSPAEAVELAKEHNLQTISITDHDTIRSYPEAREAGEDAGIEVLPGVEVTCDFSGRETHLLAYCFDVEDSGIKEIMVSHKKARLDRAEWIIGELRKQGLELDKDEVKAEAGGGNVGRPHIATVLMKKGYVGSAQEAFIRYLGDQALGPIESNYIAIDKVVEIVKDAGGATVLAHPGMLYSDDDLNRLVEIGIDGVEVLHPSHNYEQQKRYEEFAEKHSLLVTGGSDYHGGISGYQRYFGVVTISMSHVERLKRMTQLRKEISV